MCNCVRRLESRKGAEEKRAPLVPWPVKIFHYFVVYYSGMHAIITMKAGRVPKTP